VSHEGAAPQIKQVVRSDSDKDIIEDIVSGSGGVIEPSRGGDNLVDATHSGVMDRVQHEVTTEAAADNVQ
jgi:hypothetical protein